MSRSRADQFSDVHGIAKLVLKLRYHESSRQWFAVLFVLLVSLLGETTQGLFIAGTVIAAVGAAIRLWASGHVKKNKVLATDGPYAYGQHPVAGRFFHRLQPVVVLCADGGAAVVLLSTGHIL
jgi:protein-S-isoprenylcysteine O-methyltransferase Ste14